MGNRVEIAQSTSTSSDNVDTTHAAHHLITSKYIHTCDCSLCWRWTYPAYMARCLRLVHIHHHTQYKRNPRPPAQPPARPQNTTSPPYRPHHRRFPGNWSPDMEFPGSIPPDLHRPTR